jgi:hypothetical protein
VPLILPAVKRILPAEDLNYTKSGLIARNLRYSRK